MEAIKHELAERLKELTAEGRLLEAQRLEQRTNFDLEMIAATGSCAGIENYSRFLTGRLPGEPPPTLFEYLPDNALLFIDESHQTVPQIGAMARGDHRRKITLAEYGFRLPSCIDNRPLRFNEWDAMRPQTTFVSATPGPWEMNETGGVFSRAGDSPDRPHRPAGRDQAGRGPGRRPRQRGEADCQEGLSHPRHHAHQAHGRRSNRISPRGGPEGALHALRRRDAGANRADPRAQARRLRRARRHQPAARGARHSGVRAGRDPRCGQGRLPPLRDVADPDDRPRRAQRRRPGDPLRRHRHRIDGARARGNQPPPREAARVQRASTASRRRASSARSTISSPTSRRAMGWSSTPATRSGRTSSATTSRPISPTSRSGCARPPPTWSSRKRRGCATRSAGSRKTSLESPISTRRAAPDRQLERG